MANFTSTAARDLITNWIDTDLSTLATNLKVCWGEGDAAGIKTQVNDIRRLLDVVERKTKDDLWVGLAPKR